jgi:hypothetical protein
MTYPIAVVIGIIAGLAAGYAAERVPVPPIVQSAGAAFLGLLLSTFAVAVVWLLRFPSDTSVLAVTFDMTRGLLVGAGLAVVAGALHAAVGRAMGTAFPALTRHRGILLGLVGALYGAVASVSGLGIAAPLR